MLTHHGLKHWLTLLLTLLAVCWLPPAAAAQSPDGSDASTRQFQDWEVRCPNTEGAANRCTMTQLIDNPENDQPLMRVVVAHPPQVDGPVMVFLLPLGVRLAPGLQLSVDGSQGTPFPYQVCLDRGCRADLPLEPELLQQLRGGSTATLSMVGPNGQQRDLDISLMGFTAASRAIAP
ncbi:invasion protein IalB [Kushneria sinocarnis]|uniref:Invasion protein IalB n=1 Tax=Kushneria sinocarnis TaxID=595502 RepID=A0A420WUT5_9GAMM|nr:invasion associated locus B family protein [Kushneria sinocarnis]RKQ97182.1 invasion protein IalB [Kushneria sinocarnis]